MRAVVRALKWTGVLLGLLLVAYYAIVIWATLPGFWQVVTPIVLLFVITGLLQEAENRGIRR